MRKLSKYFKRLQRYHEEQNSISNWSKYMAPTETVEEYAHKMLNADPETRDKNGHLTLENILASSCSSISDIYRYNQQPSAQLQEIDNIMLKYKTKAPIVLFRGVSDIPFEKMVESAKKLHEPDTDFYERGYMSCSLLREKTLPYQVQLVIYCPAFSSIIYLGHCNDHEESECRYECIINRNAHLKVIKQEGNTYYCILNGTST
ncbi:MAG: ADP-ribosyltransferase [Candidatus Fimousia sp.]